MFVPDRAPLDELIVFSSSGTSGEPTRTPHHPYSAASGVPLLEHALRTLHGITLPRGPESIAITNVAAYSGAFTTAIVVAFLQEAGCIRVNLHPSAWRSPSDPHRFLNAMPAPVWLGDPIAFGALEQLELNDAPQAIVSSIMHLHEGYARQLTSRYGCPVIDVYAMTEAGIIAARDESGHRILAPDLFVEILDARGDRCPPGVRGEIVLSGGRNPFLPLLRYRTGDYAAIELLHGDRVLTELAGREPTSFLAESGAIVHSMEIVRLMRKHPVRRYELRSIEDGYTLLINGTVDQRALEQEMRNLLGNRFKGLNVPLDSPR